ncbi:MAG: repressor LexA [Planctomycetes bacterium]|nr:repressor LexA [Planctomycetota bacterium]MBI3845134.1 repressor LexA [Planctomycetota bacterium]
MGRTPAGKTRERILAFVRERLLAGMPPTVREVQEAFGFRAVGTAHEHLEALVAGGRLARERGKSRGFRLPTTRRGEKPVVLVPLLGCVQAGSLTTAIEDLEGHLPIRSGHGSDALFALRVEGESMTGAGILPRDVVVVRKQAAAHSGDIVVALVGEEATVKRLVVRKKRVELHPENPAFSPIVPEPEDVTILGKVIEVRRYLEGSHP